MNVGETSQVILGTMTYGRRVDPTSRIRIIHAALDHGITSLDTAPLYNFGATEEIVGRAIADRRDRVQVLTKVGLRWDGDHGEVMLKTQQGGRPLVVRKDSRPEAVRADVEGSLRRLGIETIDLCQVHHRDVHTPVGETMGALLQLRAEGKIRAIGVSNFSLDEVAQAQAALGEVGLATHQLEYSLLARDNDPLLEQADASGVGVLAYSPLKRGVLTGRASSRARFGPDDPRQNRVIFAPANARRIDAAVASSLRPIAEEHGVGVVPVALAWILAQPGIAGVIAGAGSPEQVIANAQAMSLALSPRSIAALGRAFETVRIDPGAIVPTWRRLDRTARRWLHKARGRLMPRG